MKVAMREMKKEEAQYIIDYWCFNPTYNTPEILYQMGADPTKFPQPDIWKQTIEQDFDKPSLKERSLYYLLAYDSSSATTSGSSIDKKSPFGHCNLNTIDYERQQACLHLHLWDGSLRQQGLGMKMVQESISMFFDKFPFLQRLYCEPRAENPGPNKIMKRLGFTLESTQETIPFPVCFLQNTNKWRMDKSQWEQIRKKTEGEKDEQVKH